MLELQWAWKMGFEMAEKLAERMVGRKVLHLVARKEFWLGEQLVSRWAAELGEESVERSRQWEPLFEFELRVWMDVQWAFQLVWKLVGTLDAQ